MGTTSSLTCSKLLPSMSSFFLPTSHGYAMAPLWLCRAGWHAGSGGGLTEQQIGRNLGPGIETRTECMWSAWEGSGHWQVSGEVTKGREGSQ